MCVCTSCLNLNQQLNLSFFLPCRFFLPALLWWLGHSNQKPFSQDCHVYNLEQLIFAQSSFLTHSQIQILISTYFQHLEQWMILKTNQIKINFSVWFYCIPTGSIGILFGMLFEVYWKSIGMLLEFYWNSIGILLEFYWHYVGNRLDFYWDYVKLLLEFML